MFNKNSLRDSLLKFESDFENNSSSLTTLSEEKKIKTKNLCVDNNLFLTNEVDSMKKIIFDEETDDTDFNTLFNEQEICSPAKICIIGIGGAGNNIVNSMIRHSQNNCKSVEKYALNTDQQHLLTLKNLLPSQRVLIKSTQTNGQGSGGDPDVGRRATADFAEEIKKMLTNVNLCIIIAGLGKGTGTGGGPVVAKIAREMKCNVISLLVTPSNDDGEVQFQKSHRSLKNFTAICDAISLINNDSVVDSDNMTITETRNIINKTICNTIDSIIDTVLIPSPQNIDFADFRTFIKRSENVNQLSHLQLNLFDNDPNEIKTKLLNCLNHNLYTSTIEHASKMLIQFNVSRESNNRIIKNVISEIKNLTKNDKIDIVTGIRYVDGVKKNNVEIFLTKPNFATSNHQFSKMISKTLGSEYNSATLSSTNDNFLTTGTRSEKTGVKTRALFATNSTLDNLKLNEDEELDTGRMTAILHAVLPKHVKKTNIFDDELLNFKDSKIKD